MSAFTIRRAIPSKSGAAGVRRALVASAILAAAACFGMAKAADPPVALRLALSVSLKNPLGQNVADFKTEVEEKSAGSVKVEIFDDASLFSESEIPHAVETGGADIGVVSLGEYAPEVPVAGLFLQPFLFDLKALAIAATKPKSEIRRTIEDEILASKKSRVLWWQPYGGTVLLTTGAPIANPNALTNRNVSAFDSGGADFLAICGGKPKSVRATDVFGALERKEVEASLTGILSLKERELWRVTRAVTKLRFSQLLFVVVMNDGTWSRLSEAQRAVVSNAARKVETSIWRWYNLLEADTYALAAKEGMTIHELSPQDIYDWRICSSLIMESFMTTAGAAGEKVMAAYGKLRADPCCNQ